ncbi:unnamed protein product [Amoebophrya sp. A25]|nr:unnamed protein product [Amoebophrya sp. A25]|eukprot:GSA25T00002806001.1
MFHETRTVLLFDPPSSSSSTRRITEKLPTSYAKTFLRPWFTTAMLPWSDASGRLRLSLALDGERVPGCVATRIECSSGTSSTRSTRGPRAGGKATRGKPTTSSSWVYNGPGIAECRAPSFSYTVGVSVGVHHQTEDGEDRGRECALMNWWYDTGQTAILKGLLTGDGLEFDRTRRSGGNENAAAPVDPKKMLPAQVSPDYAVFHRIVPKGLQGSSEHVSAGVTPTGGEQQQHAGMSSTGSGASQVDGLPSSSLLSSATRTSSSMETSASTGKASSPASVTLYQDPLDFLLDDRLDILIMIPVCAKQHALMNLARTTYLKKTLYFSEIQHVLDLEGPKLMPDSEETAANILKNGESILARNEEGGEGIETADKYHERDVIRARAVRAFYEKNDKALERLAKTERLLKHYPPSGKDFSITVASRAIQKAAFAVTDASTGTQLLSAHGTYILKKTRVATKWHYFVVCRDDPDFKSLLIDDEEGKHLADVLVVDVPHGYKHLAEKMTAAFRKALQMHPSVRYFVRADVDNAMDLRLAKNGRRCQITSAITRGMRFWTDSGRMRLIGIARSCNAAPCVRGTRVVGGSSGGKGNREQGIAIASRFPIASASSPYRLVYLHDETT